MMSSSTTIIAATSIQLKLYHRISRELRVITSISVSSAPMSITCLRFPRLFRNPAPKVRFSQVGLVQLVIQREKPLLLELAAVTLIFNYKGTEAMPLSIIVHPITSTRLRSAMTVLQTRTYNLMAMCKLIMTKITTFCLLDQPTKKIHMNQKCRTYKNKQTPQRQNSRKVNLKTKKCKRSLKRGTSFKALN